MSDRLDDRVHCPEAGPEVLPASEAAVRMPTRRVIEA
jgi:hypothetical protein